jgi:hypothetical protein
MSTPGKLGVIVMATIVAMAIVTCADGAYASALRAFLRELARRLF